jgi:hypothetical protein
MKENKENGFLLSLTYCSVDIIIKCLDLFDFFLNSLIEEFKNTNNLPELIQYLY